MFFLCVYYIIYIYQCAMAYIITLRVNFYVVKYNCSESCREGRGEIMDFFDKLGDTIVEKGSRIADKAKETAEIVGLKSQITTCEEVIKKNYTEIGRLYYEKYHDEPDELFGKQCRAIENAQNGVAELRKRIDEIKGM